MPVQLGDGITGDAKVIGGDPLLDPVAVWQVSDVLSGVTPPAGSRRLGIAYKTGTSYGYRDAWSVGYDGRHVLGVWVGRADSGAVPGLTGYERRRTILFEAFARSGVAITARSPARRPARCASPSPSCLQACAASRRRQAASSRPSRASLPRRSSIRRKARMWNSARRPARRYRPSS